MRLRETKLFRAKQLLYYNAKTAQFGVRTLAIAPLFLNCADVENGKCIYKRVPLFWFKAKDLCGQRRLSNRHITWARQLSFSKGIALDSAKILKTTQGQQPIGYLLKAFETEPRIPFYKKENLYPSKAISFSERKKQLWHTDTIQIVDPTTYEVTYKVVNDRVQPADLPRLELVQNWYWNNKKKRFEIYLVATAPLREMPLGVSDVVYRVPLFYRRTDD